MLQLEPSIHVDQKANKTKNQKTKIKDSNKKPTYMIKFIAVAKPKSSIKELNNWNIYNFVGTCNAQNFQNFKQEFPIELLQSLKHFSSVFGCGRAFNSRARPFSIRWGWRPIDGQRARLNCKVLDGVGMFNWKNTAKRKERKKDLWRKLKTRTIIETSKQVLIKCLMIIKHGRTQAPRRNYERNI